MSVQSQPEEVYVSGVMVFVMLAIPVGVLTYILSAEMSVWSALLHLGGVFLFATVAGVTIAFVFVAVVLGGTVALVRLGEASRTVVSRMTA